MQWDELLKQTEGRSLEFKETLPAYNQLIETVIAFSNDIGGDLYIGIANKPRVVTGIPEEELILMEEKISNVIFDRASPTIRPDISFVRIHDKSVIKVKIYRGNNTPYFIKSTGKETGTIIRVGSSNRVASREIIQELERQSQNISFDSLLVYSLELNLEQFTDFIDSYQSKFEDPINLTLLKKLGLIKTQQETDYPTNAFVLLSNQELKNRFFPYAKIECARFKGTTAGEYIDQKTFDGSILSQAEEAYDFILRHINQSATVKGVYTQTRWEYPIKAIREVIRNAVVHRDYSLTGKDIKVAIYDDAIEITSPGKLMPSIDFDSREAGQSEIRNKTIAPIFKKFGIIDQWGNGLKVIDEDLKDYHDEIDFNWVDNGMQVQISFLKSSQKSSSSVIKEASETNSDELIQTIGTKLALSWHQVGTKLAPSWHQVYEMMQKLIVPTSIQDLMEPFNLKDRSKFRNKYIKLFFELGLISMTDPKKPTSPKQQYCLTEKGKSFLDELKEKMELDHA